MSVRVDIDAREPLRALEKAYRALTPARVSSAMRAGAGVLAEGMRGRAPHRSGRLARSVEVVPLSETEFSVGTGLVYAVITEYGGTIRPNKKFLRFIGPAGPVYLRKLRIQAQPFFEPTFSSDTDAAFESVHDEFERAFS